MQSIFVSRLQLLDEHDPLGGHVDRCRQLHVDSSSCTAYGCALAPVGLAVEPLDDLLARLHAAVGEDAHPRARAAVAEDVVLDARLTARPASLTAVVAQHLAEEHGVLQRVAGCA